MIAVNRLLAPAKFVYWVWVPDGPKQRERCINASRLAGLLYSIRLEENEDREER